MPHDSRGTGGMRVGRGGQDRSFSARWLWDVRDLAGEGEGNHKGRPYRCPLIRGQAPYLFAEE